MKNKTLKLVDELADNIIKFRDFINPCEFCEDYENDKCIDHKMHYFIFNKFKYLENRFLQRKED